ncbi:MAG: hypothetical protein HZB70_01535 [Candidatus Berkelbacteria bacterium]|nr:MAG: hypothetical protein HZB70_01535 [Candidatus Berkelbacteria bacterium]QQG51985.1 MAG: hypothetical protein HY845_01460 [Candidatus Berkelbacteria bacterium]
MHGAPDITPVTSFEAQMGIKFYSLKWYQNWDQELNQNIARNYHSNGYLPELSWQPMYKVGSDYVGVSYDDVTSGQYDNYINSYAQVIKSLGFEVRISLAAEMNGDWNPWGIGKVGNNTENHKTFWRYVINKFREAGTNNVKWVWSPNIRPFGGAATYASMYPGDDYVDFTGFDGYNFSSTNGAPWLSFRQLFESSYNEMLAVTNKDMLIMEIGSVEQGGSKAQWIKEMFDDLETGFPKIKGLTWWSVAYPQFDMRINSSPASQDQFASSVKGANSNSGSNGGGQSSSGSTETTTKTSENANSSSATTSPTTDSPKNQPEYASNPVSSRTTNSNGEKTESKIEQILNLPAFVMLGEQKETVAYLLLSLFGVGMMGLAIVIQRILFWRRQANALKLQNEDARPD